MVLEIGPGKGALTQRLFEHVGPLTVVEIDTRLAVALQERFEIHGIHVITADILLADRALKAGARVLAPNGKAFTDASIGSAVAVRAIHADLRAGLGDGIQRGPAPFSKADRSRFLNALDAAVVALKKTRD